MNRRKPISLKTRRRAVPRLELTALVDCVFLLLVFFLLTSTYTRDRQIPVDLAAVRTGESVETELQRCSLTLHASGEFQIDGQAVDREGLADMLQTRALDQPETIVLIRADQKADTGDLLWAMDTARAAGLLRIQLAGREQVEGGQP